MPLAEGGEELEQLAPGRLILPVAVLADADPQQVHGLVVLAQLKHRHRQVQSRGLVVLVGLEALEQSLQLGQALGVLGEVDGRLHGLDGGMAAAGTLGLGQGRPGSSVVAGIELRLGRGRQLLGGAGQGADLGGGRQAGIVGSW